MKVSLRKIAEADTSNIVRWRNSDDVRHWLYSQEEVTPEMHLGWLRNVVWVGRCAQYIIEVEENNEKYDIGTTFIKRETPDSEEGEFGIFIGEKQAKGKHCALPATKEMLRIGFEELKLKTIFLTVFTTNIPAVKTYLHAGFTIVEEYEYSRDRNRSIYKMIIKNPLCSHANNLEISNV